MYLVYSTVVISFGVAIPSPSPTPHTSDVFLALPCDHLPVEQYEYYAISYTDGGLYSFCPRPYPNIVGCEDNTVVQIGSAVVNLNRMKTYFFEDTNDVTGTKIASNNPSGVYPGHSLLGALTFQIILELVIISLNKYPQS